MRSNACVKIIFSLLVSLLFSPVLLAQKGTVKGKVYLANTNEPVEFASVGVQGTVVGTASDSTGHFVLSGLDPGFVRLVVTAVGFETAYSPEIQVQGNQTAFIDIAVRETDVQLQEVVVKSPVGLRKMESPVSVLSVGVQELEKSAGANRDVSKVLQVLPGVGAMDANRNDLIVRGGGPSENVFYLDGIEIPVINHFATQGASGGVVGVINPDFVREVSFFTGAFPANRGNALSSVMEIKQKDGSKDRVHTKLSIGASDAALTVDGPVNERSTFIVSARQSYLQMLFKLIGLPFLPTYNDFQLKYKYEIDRKNEISLIAIGAIDNMKLNTDLQETGTESQRYLLSYLPVYKQWHYTVGAVYKHYTDHYFDTWVLSRNMLRNSHFKYKDNDESQPKTSDYISDEEENKLRFEREYPTLPVRLKLGGGVSYARYKNDTYKQQYTEGEVSELSYATALDLWDYHAFVQASKEFFSKRMSLSLGVNVTGNNYNNHMKNPLNQFSPRLSLSYVFSDTWSVGGNVGRYAAQPAYTIMGFKDAEGRYVNRHDSLRYTLSNHFIGGFTYKPADKMSLSVEGFYKQYEQYPISIADGISLASKGTGYDQIGDEAIVSSGKGRAYGVEALLKIMEWKNMNVSATYTWFRSLFTDREGEYVPSIWDTRHLFNLMASYKFGKSWHVATRWRYVGGAPYSPIDWNLSTNREAWNVTNQAYTDYTRFNSLRLKDAHQLDIRIDKEFYFKNWVLNVYVDVQNAYNFQSQTDPIYTNKDEQGELIADPGGDPQKQGLRILDSTSGTILPTIGLIIKI